MNENEQLTTIYALVVPLCLTLLWFLRKRSPCPRIPWLAESMQFFNTRSNLVINYWKNNGHSS